MAEGLLQALKRFVEVNRLNGKGALCVALIVTQHARAKGLPLDCSSLVTEGGGQVLGLGKGAVQSVLSRHGITRVLAAEGGRTSRGSIGIMQSYVAFLNKLAEYDEVDLDLVESFWIERVTEFFAQKPFKIRLDASRSLRAVVQDVLKQAEARQKLAAIGAHTTGAVLQHLVGAKLDCALGSGIVAHNSYSTSDAQSGRAGDFVVGDVAIHVTTSPGEAVIERCRENLDCGFRPLLVTMQRGLAVAEVLADNAGIADRLDVFEVEQFIALNLYELSKFTAQGRLVAIDDFIRRYNEVVGKVETDPSLRIDNK